MPELPEVETIKTQLTKPLVGQTIQGVSLSGKNMRHNPEAALLPHLKGETVKALYRRNKYLVIETTTLWLVYHLGMSGQLLLKDKNEKVALHEHVSLGFSAFNLSLIDPRRFGGFSIFEKKNHSNYSTIPLFKNLGIEPLSPDYTLASLKALLKDSNQHMKQFLLDAGNVCGIGNIYACEILFRTQLLPTRLGKSLTSVEKNKLFKEISKVLELAISLGGSTISDFKHVNGQSGQMQTLYKVYDREGKPCLVCATPIKRLVQNARSTYYCPHCQK